MLLLLVALQDTAGVIAAMEKNVAEVRDLTVHEEGDMTVVREGRLLRTEFRTVWVRGRGIVVEASGSIDPLKVQREMPPLEVYAAYAETPEALHARFWVTDLPSIAKGFVVPYLNLREEKPAADPLSLPRDLPARAFFDRLPLLVSLEPSRWIPADAAAKADGDHIVLTATTPFGVEDSFADALPIGDLTREFRVDAASHRLVSMRLSVPVSVGLDSFHLEYEVTDTRDGLPSGTKLTLVAYDRGRREEGVTLTSKATAWTLNGGAEIKADWPAGTELAVTRVRAMLEEVLRTQREPQPIGGELKDDMEKALRAEPDNAAVLAAYLEMHGRIKDEAIEAKWLDRDLALPEAALLLSDSLKADGAVAVLDRALAGETLPFFRRRMQASKVVRLAKAGRADEAAAAMGEDRAFADTLILRAMAEKLSSEKLAAAVGDSPVGPYVRAVVALRDGDVKAWAAAAGELMATPEGADEVVAQARRLLFPTDYRSADEIPKVEEAEEAILALADRMIERAPEEPLGHFIKARADEEALDGALDVLEKAAAKDGWTADRIALLGSAVPTEAEPELTDRLARASKLFLAAAEKNVEAIPWRLRYDANPTFAHAKALLRERQYADLLGLLTHPGFGGIADYAYNVWYAFNEGGQVSELMEFATEQLGGEGLSAEACEVLAGAVQHMWSSEAATIETFLEKAAEAHAERPMLWYQLANRRRSNGIEGSTEPYLKAIELWEQGGTTTGNEQTYRVQARLAVAQDWVTSNPDGALAQLRAIDMSAGSGVDSRTVAQLFRQLDKPDEALAALDASKNDAWIFLDYAMALESAGRLLEAYAYFRRAAEHEKQNEWAYSHLDTTGEGRTAARALDEFNARVGPAKMMEEFFAQKFDAVGDEERAQVERLLRRLRAEDAAVRDGAQAELAKLGKKIAPLLRGHLDDEDPEVRTRVGHLIEGWMLNP